MSNFLPGVTAHDIKTDRLTVHYLAYGPEDGIPVVLVHGNMSSGRFYEHLMPLVPDGYRIIMPDMRGFGDTEQVPIDATRGLQDWADDVYALVQALGIDQPIHIAGWSTGGAAVAAYAADRPEQVASLTFINTVSPYGFGGVKLDGTPCFPDWAGSGGGAANPDFVQRVANKDRSADEQTSPRNVMATAYWSPEYQMPEERMDILLTEMFKAVIGDEGYPGDMTASENWPMIAPGTQGILNAVSGKYCNWTNLADIDPKPPVLWTHGTADVIVGDNSLFDLATLGQMGLVPGWPGEDICPPQPMVTQTRAIFEQYEANGGRVQTEMFEGSGHGPIFDAAEKWAETFFGFLKSV